MPAPFLRARFRGEISPKFPPLQLVCMLPYVVNYKCKDKPERETPEALPVQPTGGTEQQIRQGHNIMTYQLFTIRATIGETIT